MSKVQSFQEFSDLLHSKNVGNILVAFGEVAKNPNISLEKKKRFLASIPRKGGAQILFHFFEMRLAKEHGKTNVLSTCKPKACPKMQPIRRK